jgi:hypothetical protein
MESTYVVHHAERAALAGLINSIPAMAMGSDEPTRQLCDKLTRDSLPLLDAYHKSRLRSNLGLRSASENTQQEDGLCGSGRPLSDRSLLELKRLLCTGNDYTSVLGTDVREWDKIIVCGQEYNAYDSVPTGSHAIVNILDRTEIARIRRICRGLSGDVSIIAQILPKPSEDIEDVWTQLELGFLVVREPCDQFLSLSTDKVKCGAVLTPVVVEHMELYVVIPHSKVSPDGNICLI